MKTKHTRDIQVSIVSHGQLALIDSLLSDLSELKCADRLQVSITLNIHEKTDGLLDKYPLYVSFIENSIPKGFAENHNYAFRTSPISNERKYFIILNPDIRIMEDIISILVSEIGNDNNIGVIVPAVTNTAGIPEDSARALPTWSRLFAKLFGKTDRWTHNINDTIYYPDWVAGMFMVFCADTFEHIGGFNEEYFLYYEDVDICSRLWLEGMLVQVDSSVSIIHDARRDSRKKLKYLRWHLASMWRFLCSDIYSQVKKFHSLRNNGAI